MKMKFYRFHASLVIENFIAKSTLNAEMQKFAVYIKNIRRTISILRIDIDTDLTTNYIDKEFQFQIYDEFKMYRRIVN